MTWPCGPSPFRSAPQVVDPCAPGEFDCLFQYRSVVRLEPGRTHRRGGGSVGRPAAMKPRSGPESEGWRKSRPPVCLSPRVPPIVPAGRDRPLVVQSRAGPRPLGRRSVPLAESIRGPYRTLKQDQAAGFEASTRAIRGSTATDDDKAWPVEVRGQFGAGVAVDLDHGLPGSGEPGDQEPLAFHALEPDPTLAKVEAVDQLRVDLLVIPQLGNVDGRFPGACLGRHHFPPRAPCHDIASVRSGGLAARLEEPLVVGDEVMVGRAFFARNSLSTATRVTQVLPSGLELARR